MTDVCQSFNLLIGNETKIKEKNSTLPGTIMIILENNFISNFISSHQNTFH